MRRPVLALFLLILASSEYLSQVAARSQAKENETKHQSHDYKRMDGDHGGRGTRRAHALRDRKSNIDNKMHDQKGSKGVYNGLRDRRAGIVPIWPAKNSWVEGSIYKKLGKERKIQGFPKKEKLHNICFFSVCNFGEGDKNKKKKNNKKKSKKKKKNNNKNDNNNHGIHDNNNNSIDTKNHSNDNHHNDNHPIPDTYDHHNDNHEDPDHISENIPDSDNNNAPNESYNHSPENMPNSNNNFASNSKESSFNSPENIPSFHHVEKTEPIDRIIVNNHLDYINNHGPEFHSVEKTVPIDHHVDYNGPYNHSPENTPHKYDNFDPNGPNHSPENTPHKYDNFDPNGPNHSPENTPHKYDNFDPDDSHYYSKGGESFGLDYTHASYTDNRNKNYEKLSKTINNHIDPEDIEVTTKKVNKCYKNPYVLDGMECETTSGPLDPEVVAKIRQKHLEFKKRLKEKFKDSEKNTKNSNTAESKYKNKKRKLFRPPQNSKDKTNRFLSHPLK